MIREHETSLPADLKGLCPALAARIHLPSAIVSFLIMACLLGAAFSILIDSASVRAVRESLLQSWMKERAYNRPPGEDAIVVFVALDSRSCPVISENSERNIDCVDDERIDRTDTAQLLKAIAPVTFGTVLLDVSFYPTGCDAASLDIVTGILTLSERNYIILPYSLSRLDRTYRVTSDLFDDCYSLLSEQQKAQLSQSGKIFMGQTLVYSNSDFGGASGVHDWLEAVVPIKGDPGFAVRRVPSVSLLAAMLAETRDNPAALSMVLGNWRSDGIAVSWRPDQAASQGVTIPPCNPATSAFCGYFSKNGPEQADTASPSRISYRLGWRPPDQLVSDLDRAWRTRFLTLKSHDMSPAYSEWIGAGTRQNNSLLVIAAGPDSPDVHNTPIGIIPGGWLLANAYFDYRTNGFSQFDLKPLNAWTIALEIARLSILALLAVAVLLGVIILLRQLGKTGDTLTIILARLAWPAAIIAVSIQQILQGWSGMSNQFDDRAFLIALFALVGGAFDIRSILDSMGHSVIRTMLTRWRAAPTFKPGQDDEH